VRRHSAMARRSVAVAVSRRSPEEPGTMASFKRPSGVSREQLPSPKLLRLWFRSLGRQDDQNGAAGSGVLKLAALPDEDRDLLLALLERHVRTSILQLAFGVERVASRRQVGADGACGFVLVKAEVFKQDPALVYARLPLCGPIALQFVGKP